MNKNQPCHILNWVGCRHCTLRVHFVQCPPSEKRPGREQVPPHGYSRNDSWKRFGLTPALDWKNLWIVYIARSYILDHEGGLHKLSVALMLRCIFIAPWASVAIGVNLLFFPPAPSRTATISGRTGHLANHPAQRCN